MKNLLALLFLVFSSTVDVSASGPPQWVLDTRPSGAPHLAVSAFERIQGSLTRNGSTKVIVRVAPGAELPDGFAVEAELTSSMAVGRQRAILAKIQKTVLSRISPGHAARAQRYDFIPFMALDVDEADFRSLVESPEIDSIEEDLPEPPLLAQSVPLIGGDGNGTFGGFSGQGQVIAILDTGVDKSHPFLAGKVIAEGCYSTSYAADGSTAVCTSGSTAPGAGVNCAVEGCSHGTHVAGIAAGKGTTFNGVAKDAGIIAVQIFSQFPQSSCGSGATGPCVLSYTSDQISGLQYIYNLRNTYPIASVNMSLGGGSYSTYCDANQGARKTAIDNLRAAGIATVIASGNDGYTASISSPACISTAVSVGSTDKSDRVASYSNSASILKLLAPGSAITSSVPGGYASGYGTSMATPHVAGAWAVLKSAKPNASVDEVLNALVSSGIGITDSRNGIVKPRIKVDAAVAVLQNRPSHTLTVTRAGTGTGTVAGAAGISCGTSCTATVAEGTNITLTAVPAAGSGFAGWSGACTGTGTCSFTVTADATVSASFILTATVGSESFATAGLPAGWTVTGTPSWRFDDPKTRSNLTGSSESFAIADSDYAGHVDMDTELRSPAYDLSPFSAAYVTFRTYFHRYGSEVCDMDISTDGGNTWTNAWRKTGNDYGPASENVDISAMAAGKSGVRIRFHYYNANYDWYWQVDEFAISGSGTAMYTVGLATSGNGAITCTPSATVQYGTSTTCTAKPGQGSYITAVSIDNAAQDVVDRSSFTYPFGPLATNHSMNASFTPIAPPGAPVMGTATAGNSMATVSFIPPVSDGGNTITYYTVASSGGQTASGTASPIAVTGLANGTAYTFTVSATNTAGTGPPSAPSPSVIPFRLEILNITIDGSGSGQVISTPAGITCSNGSSSGCSSTFTDTTTVTLQAVPRWNALFGGWGGNCTGTGTCSMLTDTSRTVSATFTPKQNVFAPGSTPAYFSTVQAAYDAVNSSGTIQVENAFFYEDLLLDKPVDVTLEGGRDVTFTTQTGSTTIEGSITVSRGTVVLGNIIVR